MDGVAAMDDVTNMFSHVYTADRTLVVVPEEKRKDSNIHSSL